jgi:hypothetical protein
LDPLPGGEVLIGVLNQNSNFGFQDFDFLAKIYALLLGKFAEVLEAFFEVGDRLFELE